MLEALNRIDQWLFYWINNGQQNVFFDHLMPWVTGSGNWHPPILIIFCSLLLFGGRRERAAALLVIPLITLSDQTCSHLLKHVFERTRPCHVLDHVHLLVGCGSSFSMPSSHAANFGAAAFHFAFFYPRLRRTLWSFALLMSYSRVYVGVHYPLDVLMGLLLGLLIAAGIQAGYKWTQRARS